MILDALANFATDVLLHPAEKVIIENSWKNYKQINWSDNIILVGMISKKVQGTSEIFNPINESIEYVSNYTGIATFTFYGDESEDNALHFVPLCKAERSIQSAKENYFTYKLPKTVTHIGKVVGSQNQHKYQIEMMVAWSESATVETLRIDTADIQFLVNK